MRNRGKREVETYNNNEAIVDNTNNNNNNNNNNNYINNNGYYGEGFMEFPCKKHPTSPSTSTGGICAYCLTDRLYQLVCPQCGELSNTCSCTQSFSFNNNNNNNSNNSSSYGDVGNVGRISFLLENDKVVPNNNNVDFSSSRPRLVEQRSRASFSSNVDDHNNYRPTLRRSNSTCVSDLSYAPTSSNSTTSTNIGRKESSKDKFWKIGRLFRKKKDKSHNNNNNYNTNYNNTNLSNDQENNNGECTGVPRSRSLSSFRGFCDTEESGNFPISSSAARASSVSTGNFYADSAKQSCFSESEARMSNFDSYFDPSGFNKNNNNNNNSNNNIYSVKETEFVSDEDPAYIDLKLHNMSSSSSDYHHSNNNYNNRVPDLGTLRRSGLGMSSTKEFSYRGSNYNENDDIFGNDQMLRNNSCRRSSVTERELRKCRKSSKVLKWFFKHQSSSRDNDEDDLHHHGFN